MRWSLFLVLVAAFCLLIDTTDAKKRKRKDGERRRRRNRNLERLEELEKEIEEFQRLELTNELNESDEDESKEDENDNNIEDIAAPQNEDVIDVCERHYCGAGKECVNIGGEPACQCIAECPYESDPRRKTCSNHNETWDGDCLVYQMRCWCNEDNNDKCKDEKYKHLHIDYYGVCQTMPECSEQEMSEFPERMRDWLHNIMKDLADRQELTLYYQQLEKENEEDIKQRWANAVVWKWCDLDGHPPDRKVSRHELFPIRAPLITLEYCIAPFLDRCDEDNDHYITLEEWGKCLGLDTDEIEDKCEKIAETLD